MSRMPCQDSCQVHLQEQIQRCRAASPARAPSRPGCAASTTTTQGFAGRVVRCSEPRILTPAGASLTDGSLREERISSVLPLPICVVSALYVAGGCTDRHQNLAMAAAAAQRGEGVGAGALVRRRGRPRARARAAQAARWQRPLRRSATRCGEGASAAGAGAEGGVVTVLGAESNLGQLTCTALRDFGESRAGARGSRLIRTRGTPPLRRRVRACVRVWLRAPSSSGPALSAITALRMMPFGARSGCDAHLACCQQAPSCIFPEGSLGLLRQSGL